MASQPIYQFYAELSDYKPKMWRRFEVSNNVTMAKLGYILMTMFEMQASHLFCFDYPFEANFRRKIQERYSQENVNTILSDSDLIEPVDENWHIEIPTEDTMDCFDATTATFYDATKVAVKQIISNPTDTMTFSYDYGDDWTIDLVLEKIIEDKDLDGKLLPRVLEGEGYGIIEDCGGTGGLEEITKAFEKKNGSQYESFCEWLGVVDLDLFKFNLDDMNFRLKKVPRIYADIYEHQLEPTKRSMDILTRKYLNK